ncbi:hypothetical protein C8A00DRAFT_11547 [Chaetomidium leptoderma]|uniref:Uncharacterized protein n=1 Tax=Chaetomidium leptoderma TaxID=669021 RepID=A0AAN7A291_9PEZI|nr:hypothetical protein C8A00DRAFT_11547 [Chaetomidium leptoderma]
MAPKEKKERTTNFKTYEAQSRLLSALVASLGNHRLDFKKIAKNHGGSATESSMEHRFRVIKAQADFITALVEAGLDPASYETWMIRNKDGKPSRLQARRLARPAAASITAAVVVAIALFGASTPDGLNFQFRSVKKGADALTHAVENGQDPVNAFGALMKGGSSVPATPSHRTPGSTKRARPTKTPTSSATPASKRLKATKLEPELEFDEDDEDSPEADYSELDSTPTKTKPKKFESAGQLLPRPAWAKPAPGEKPAVRGNVAIAPAPAPPRPAAPAYTLAPIAGIAAVPNGYTNPATGVGYNCVPPTTTMGSAAPPSAVISPAMGMTSSMRRNSVFSAAGSHTAASSPGTPTISHYPPVPNTTSSPSGMGSSSHYPPVPGTTNMSYYTTNMYDAIPSPTTSASDASSHTMAAASASASSSSVKPQQTAAAATAPFNPEQEFRPFAGFATTTTAGSSNNGNGNGNGNGARNGGHAAYSFDHREAAQATQIDFGGFEDGDEEEEEEGEEWWDDAGDC